jgi:hypothetical protein
MLALVCGRTADTLAHGAGTDVVRRADERRFCSRLGYRRHLLEQLTSAAKPSQHGQNKPGTQPVDRQGPRQRPVAIRTLGDLGEQSQLYAYCDACRYSTQLDLTALRERYGPQLSLKRLQARLRCSHCGARAAQTFHVWDAGPHARA